MGAVEVRDWHRSSFDARFGRMRPLSYQELAS